MDLAIVATPTTKQYFYICSFDHDGLGRYGDPINPVGDIVAMETVMHVLKEGGLLFLTVPIGTHIMVPTVTQ